jgi:hypothetical protein
VVARLGTVLEARWAALGMEPEALIDFGDAGVVVAATGRRVRVRVLTVPKSALGVEELNDLLARLDPEPGAPLRADGGRDVFCYCADEGARQAIAEFVGTLKGGGVSWAWVPDWGAE